MAALMASNGIQRVICGPQFRAAWTWASWRAMQECQPDIQTQSPYNPPQGLCGRVVGHGVVIAMDARCGLLDLLRRGTGGIVGGAF